MTPAAYTVPPEIYDIGFGWDPQPEIERLLSLSRQVGVEPESALELGCGTGRLLRALGAIATNVCGIELSLPMAQWAHTHTGKKIVVSDMSSFALNCKFDLIYTSANTIRHVLTDNAIMEMWSCIGKHLRTGGVFIADLELGLAAEAEKVGKPDTWMIGREETLVRSRWMVVEAPSLETHCSTIEFTFEVDGAKSSDMWQERFKLRAYDTQEFLQFATNAGFELRGIYELRDPYLFERSPETAVGRCIVVCQQNVPQF